MAVKVEGCERKPCFMWCCCFFLISIPAELILLKGWKGLCLKMENGKAVTCKEQKSMCFQRIKAERNGQIGREPNRTEKKRALYPKTLLKWAFTLFFKNVIHNIQLNFGLSPNFLLQH